jgi:uncharacterized protein (DUF1697 family)
MSDKQIVIVFLRAVNMAGHNSIKMKDLGEMFVDMGYPDAKIYIQSGNVIFRSDEDRNTLIRKVSEAIKQEFGHDIAIMIRTVEEVRNLAGRNPYLEEEGFDPSKMAVVFLNKEPSAESVEKMADVDFPPDKYLIDRNEIFIYCPNGFGRSKLTTVFFERKLNVFGTARNWKTINSILDISKKV